MDTNEEIRKAIEEEVRRDGLAKVQRKLKASREGLLAYLLGLGKANTADVIERRYRDQRAA